MEYTARDHKAIAPLRLQQVDQKTLFGIQTTHILFTR